MTDLAEQAETFTVHLANAAGATIDDADGVVTILDRDDPAPVARIGAASGPEGNAGNTPTTLTVVLDKPSATPVTVQWATAPDTADATDFVAASGDVTFAPNDVSEQITVQTRGDRTPEGNESYFVKLAGTDETGLVTVTDDDTGSPPGEVASVRIGDVRVPEGNADSSPAAVTVVLDQVSDVPVTVRWNTKDGTATAPGDYTAGDDVLTFEPGATSQQVTVPVAGDRSFEQPESFGIELSEPVNATIADGTAVVSVDNDDEQVSSQLTVDDVSVTENAGPAGLTVRLSTARSDPVTVRLATRAGGATDPADFRGVDKAVTFAPGETVVPVPVEIVDDTAAEPVETFAVDLSDASGATVADPSAVVTIVDDDGGPGDLPVVSVSDTSVREDAGPAGFEVRLSEATDEEFTVAWATGDGTATSPDDYMGASGTVVFTPGQVSALVPVTVVNDTRHEGDETFTLTLSGATVDDGTAVGTIVDDDTGTPGAVSCTASAANLLGTRPAVANPGGTPCADDTKTAARVNLGLGLLAVRVDGLTATTDAAPGGVSATAGLLTTRISTIGLVIEIGTITSTATATCVAGPAGLTPSFAGSSAIASLKVNGVAVPIGSGPVTVPLLVGSLTLNSTVATADGVTQRAFDLRTLLGKVVIGESKVGGDPCH